MERWSGDSPYIFDFEFVGSVECSDFRCVYLGLTYSRATGNGRNTVVERTKGGSGVGYLLGGDKVRVVEERKDSGWSRRMWTAEFL